MARAARRPRRQAQRPRLLLSVAAAVAAAACANMGEPPGGPPDVTPPSIIWIRPDSGAIVPDLHDDLVIQYDEVIDEQPGTGGTSTGAAVAGLASHVILSPVVGPVKVSWHRTAIGVKPKEGWKPGRVYHLQILPGIADLRRNVVKQGRTLVFTTGPEIPSASLSGTALMWTEQRLLVSGLVRAARLPDSAAYLTVTDSVGQFHFDQIPPGRYLVMAVVDLNNNRLRDRREAFDSTIVTLDSSAQATLWTFVHDTLGPRLQTLEPVDTTGFRMSFSLPLDPYRPLDSLRLRFLSLPDSTPVPIAGIVTSTQFDSITKRERAVADSLRQDSLARLAPKDTTRKGALPPTPDTARARVARPDTTRRRPAAPPLGGVLGQPPGPPTGVPGGAHFAAPDTLVKRLLAGRPVPQDKLVVRLEKGKFLVPGAKYYVEVAGAVNLNGATATSHNVLVVPKAPPPPPPPAPADTTHGAKPVPTKP